MGKIFQTLCRLLDEQIGRENKDAEKAKNELDKNFTDAFQWGYAEMYYKSLYNCRVMTRFEGELVAAADDDELGKSFFREKIDETVKQLLRGQFRGTSTSESSNTAKVYEKECDAQFAEYLTLWLQWAEGATAHKYTELKTKKTKSVSNR